MSDQTLYRIVEDFDGDLGNGERNARVRAVEPAATITVKGHGAVRTDQGWLRGGSYVVVVAVDE